MFWKSSADQIETERFLLVPTRPFALATRTLHWTRNPETFVYIGNRTGDCTFRRWYRDLRARAARNGTLRQIVVKDNRECIGLHIVHASKDSYIAATTTIIGEKSWWGKGVQREVGNAMIDYCFETLKVSKISNIVADSNRASVRNCDAMGYTLEGRLRNEFVLHDGRREDKLLYGITRADWLRLRRDQTS